MSKSEDKMVKQSDQDSPEQTENKECLLGNRESHPLSPPTGGYVSLSYPTPDFAKQSDFVNILVMCSSYKNVRDRMTDVVHPEAYKSYTESIIVVGNKRFIYRSPDQFDQIMGIEINELIVEPDVELTDYQKEYLDAHVRPRSKYSGSKQSDTDIAGYMSLISEYYRNPILVQGIILSSGR